MPGFIPTPPIPETDGRFLCRTCREEVVPHEDRQQNDGAAGGDGSVGHFRCLPADLYELHLRFGGHP
jgi:hypothetical protein